MRDTKLSNKPTASPSRSVAKARKCISSSRIVPLLNQKQIKQLTKIAEARKKTERIFRHAAEVKLRG